MHSFLGTNDIGVKRDVQRVITYQLLTFYTLQSHVYNFKSIYLPHTAVVIISLNTVTQSDVKFGYK